MLDSLQEFTDFYCYSGRKEQDQINETGIIYEEHMEKMNIYARELSYKRLNSVIRMGMGKPV